MHGKKTGGKPAVILIPVVLAGMVHSVQAGVLQDCRQEAGAYGIVPEQVEEYVQGCVLSRGGEMQPASGQETALQDDGTAGNHGMPVPETAGNDMSQDNHDGVEETTDGAQ